MPGLPVHHQLPEFTQLMSIKSVMPSSHLILGRPLLLLPHPTQNSYAEALNLTWLYLEIVFRKVINFNLDFKNDVLIL